MSRSSRKFCSMIIKNILPFISYIFIFMSCILQFGAQNSMGIYRDLVYRNTILKNTILTLKLLHLYTVIALVGMTICIVVLYIHHKKFKSMTYPLKSNNVASKFRKYLFKTIGLSLLFIFMITFHDKITWIAYPLMILTIGIGIIIQYIRIIYTYRLMIVDLN